MWILARHVYQSLSAPVTKLSPAAPPTERTDHDELPTRTTAPQLAFVATSGPILPPNSQRLLQWVPMVEPQWISVDFDPAWFSYRHFGVLETAMGDATGLLQATPYLAKHSASGPCAIAWNAQKPPRNYFMNYACSPIAKQQ